LGLFELAQLALREAAFGAVAFRIDAIERLEAFERAIDVGIRHAGR